MGDHPSDGAEVGPIRMLLVQATDDVGSDAVDERERGIGSDIVFSCVKIELSSIISGSREGPAVRYTTEVGRPRQCHAASVGSSGATSTGHVAWRMRADETLPTKTCSTSECPNRPQAIRPAP